MFQDLECVHHMHRLRLQVINLVRGFIQSSRQHRRLPIEHLLNSYVALVLLQLELLKAIIIRIDNLSKQLRVEFKAFVVVAHFGVCFVCVDPQGFDLELEVAHSFVYWQVFISVWLKFTGDLFLEEL